MKTSYQKEVDCWRDKTYSFEDS